MDQIPLKYSQFSEIFYYRIFKEILQIFWRNDNNTIFGFETHVARLLFCFNILFLVPEKNCNIYRDCNRLSQGYFVLIYRNVICHGKITFLSNFSLYLKMNLKKGNSGLDKGFINGTGDIVMNLIMFIYTWKAFIKVICIKVNHS